jgi:putative acetyltransferase
MTDGRDRIFTGAAPEPVPIAIRLERPGDEPGVRGVNLAAFTGPEEAAIVDRIRAEAPAGWQSLVAVTVARPGALDVAGAPGIAPGAIVGHLLLSPCPVIDDHGAVVGEVLAIGPVAVLPAVQFRGIGSALMASATSLAVARAVSALVLLGHPAYYPRFGFETARGMGLQPPDQRWPDAAWMARRLPAWTGAIRGTVRYPEAFEPFA